MTGMNVKWLPVLLVCLATGTVFAAPAGCPKAEAQFAKGQHEAAAQEAEDCLQAEPQNRQALIVLVRALAAQNRVPDAIAAWDRREVAWQQDPELLLWRVRLLAWRGDLPQAEAILAEAPPAAKDGEEGRLLAAELSYWAKNFDAAVPRFTAILEANPKNVEALLDRAASYRELGEIARAVDDFDQACRLKPADSTPCRQRDQLRLWGVFCPQARKLREDGKFEKAEQEAAQCLKEQGDQPALWLELAQDLAGQGRESVALTWLDKVIHVHPDQPPLRVLQLRYLARSGDYQAAWKQVGKLPKTVLDDPEVRLAIADIAYWKKDYAEAAKRYTAYLEKRPDDQNALRTRAISRFESGDKQGAAVDFDVLCQRHSGWTQACEQAEIARHGDPRFRLTVRPSWTYVDVFPDWWDVQVSLEARVWRTLQLGTAVEFHKRDTGHGPQYDVPITLFSGYRFDEHWGLEVGLGFTPAAELSPLVQFWVEPSYSPIPSLTFLLRYWFPYWTAGNAHVLSPAFVWTPGRFHVDGRYYLAFESGGRVTHAGQMRFGCGFLGRLFVYVGAGLGNRSDYIEMRRSLNEWHWLLMTGLSVMVAWRHDLLFDYIFRDERERSWTFQRHQFQFGYRVRF